jgi:hypothetical protein
MADLSGSQQHLDVHSSEAAAGSSIDSAAATSSTLNKKGKKTVGGFEFTSELQSIASSILQLEVSAPPTSMDNSKNDMFFDEDEGSPEDWVPTNIASTKNSSSSTVRRALTPMPREEAIAAVQSVLLEATNNKNSSDSNKPTSLISLLTIKAMSDLVNAHAKKYPNQSDTASTIRNQLEKALISSTLKFDVKVQEMSK